MTNMDRQDGLTFFERCGVSRTRSTAGTVIRGTVDYMLEHGDNPEYHEGRLEACLEIINRLEGQK